MTAILNKVIYIFCIMGINLYFCSYLTSKVSARSELRRGFVASRIGGLGYPFVKLFRYLAKDYKLNIWEVFLFFFSLFIWTVVPFSQTLTLIKFDQDLLMAFLFYLLLIFLILTNSSRSNHGYIFQNMTKNVLMIYTFMLPVFFCVTSLVIINRTLNLKEITGFQYQYWNIVYQPLGFIVFFTSVLLQLKLFGLTKSNPVLFTENQEKEGAGLGRLIVRVARYSALFFLIVMISILYLGGWHSFYFINGNIIFILKFYIIFFILLLLDKATPGLDDYRYLVSINWRFLVPFSAANFLLTIIFFILRNIYNLI
ncbi:MAG: hypothetical protein FJW66_02035 [Actinobacteria bacterium]|nr:hypothetical protein [Actinomycetota bacterium]